MQGLSLAGRSGFSGEARLGVGEAWAKKSSARLLSEAWAKAYDDFSMPFAYFSKYLSDFSKSACF